MKRTLTVLAILALAAGNAFAADKILKGDQFAVAGIAFPQPFKTLSGQVLKAGTYDLKVVSDGTENVLIGLFVKGGKQVGQVRGIAKALPPDQTLRSQPDPGGLGKALPVDQGVKKQWTPRGGVPASGIVTPSDNKVQPAGVVTPSDNKTFRELGFTPASRVSFLAGAGKIFSTQSPQPGAILPYIELLLPAVPNMK